MSGIFNSLNTSTKGLMASQTALHTTGHNIANINTEGFSRQRVDMKADRAFNYAGVGQLGTGVRMSAISRMVDDHVSKQVRAENSTLNRYAEKSEVIDQLEVIFNEPSDTGLNFNIGEMFDAFQELSKNPENLNSKTVVIEKLKTLTESLNHMAKQIDSLETETHAAIGKNLLDLNTKIEQLGTLNKQIFNISIKGQVPNDLLDQRDLMLKELTAIADVEVTLDDKHGRVELTLDGNKLLSKEGEQKYVKYDDVGEINLANKEGELVDSAGTLVSSVSVPPVEKVAIEIGNGKLKGNIEALVVIKKSKTNLDKMANTMAQAINTTHKKGDINNKSIFTDKEGNSITINASNIQVNGDIANNPKELQAGQGGSSVGDGSLALDLARLRNQKIDDMGEVDPSGDTISGRYRDIVITVGISKQHSDNMVKNQQVLTGQLEQRRESISGVSINDEITNVIKFQKAYEANAKVISALTEMLDVLINRTGV